MQKDLGNYRKSYEKATLSEDAVLKNPIEQFQKWFDEAERGESIVEPNAMTLSTIGIDDFPRGRIVLMKEFSEEGFIFYTNYESEKGKAITSNPNVCLSFFWQELERQVIIKGRAEKVSREKSEKYFHSRPRESQMSAFVSHQSEIIPSREILEKKLMKVKRDYKEQEIPMPYNWGGYLVKPISMEFWQGRKSRLHDRISYRLNENLTWKIERLQP